MAKIMKKRAKPARKVKAKRTVRTSVARRKVKRAARPVARKAKARRRRAA